MGSLLASIALVGWLSIAGWSSAGQPPASQASEAFPEGTGKAATLRVCSACHPPEGVVETLRTRQQWSDVIDQMAQFGAQASDQEFEQILIYLAKFFSPIRINTATAKDLENTLDVPAAAAEAIVSYRSEHGPFKAIDDLKPVPGLDWAKVEARKGRLVFST
jgi:competence protein ComEA